MKYLLLTFLLVGCGSETKEIEPTVQSIGYVNPSINLEYIGESTYWSIPQYFNGVPKYTAYGTYTHKHIPLAVKHNGNIYHVYTDNTVDDNFYVYVAKNNEEKVLVHTIENWEDPHTNAVVNALDDGTIRIHVAARGINNGFQSGFVLESVAPESLDFVCIDGCQSNNIEGYPQIHNTAWGEQLIYSRNAYDYDIHPKQWMREPWSKNKYGRQQIVKGGHYSISFYDKYTDTFYIVYNWLKEGSPSKRHNLYGLKTKNGKDWTTFDDKPVSLPVSEDYQDARILYSGDWQIFLKDITYDSDGIKVMYTNSNSVDPTKGYRSLRELRWNGTSKFIKEVNHNYGGGAYVGRFILFTNGNEPTTGADLILLQDYHEIDRVSDMRCAYVRKVRGSDNKAVVSCDDYNGNAGHYLLTIE